MKAAVMLLALLAAFPALAAAEVVISPSASSVNANISTNFTISVNLTSNDTSTYTNIWFNSTYIVNFVPAGAVLANGTYVSFNLTLNVPYFTGSANNTLVNDTIYVEATNGSSGITLGDFLLSIVLSLQNANYSQRDYFFKKCFLDNNDEFCSPFNISDVQNVTILIQNVTYQNITWDLVVPFNVTRDFMQAQTDKVQTMAANMSSVRDDIKNMTDTMIYIQNRTDNMYKNAFLLDGFIKNPNTDLWVQVFPANMLINSTGLDQKGFDDAMSYLYQTGKLQQKTEVKQVSLTLADGSVSTKNINFITVASAERVLQVESDTTNANIVTAAVLIAIVSVCLVVFYFTMWRKRVKV